jgi:hypothetical protein
MHWGRNVDCSSKFIFILYGLEILPAGVLTLTPLSMHLDSNTN